MSENEKIQDIIQEYFKEQEKTKLTLCIYDNDIEYFYKDEQWHNITILEQPQENEDDDGNLYILKSETTHNFTKNAEIENLSFNYFMAYQYFKLHNIKSEPIECIQTFIDSYKKRKSTNPEYTVEKYIEYRKNQKNVKQPQKPDNVTGCLGCFALIVIIFLIFILFKFISFIVKF